MPLYLSHAIQRVIRTSCHLLQTRFIAWTKPPHYGLVRGLTSDLARGKAGMVAENALLRQQLIVLQRQVNRPSLTRFDRLLLLLLASRLPTWRQALMLIQPVTLLHWHRQGFRLFWEAELARPSAQPRSAAARSNTIWRQTALPDP